MKTKTFSSRSGLLVAGLGFAMFIQAGCSFLPEPKADPTRYYVLTGPAVDESGARQVAGAFVVGLKSVQVAPYLNGKAMIVRNATNEIAYQEFARWAEPLDVGVGRMLSARLVASDKIKRLYSQPFPFDVERDYDVRIEVLRCEGEHKPDGKTVASLACVVEVTEAKTGGAVVLRKVFTAPEAAWNGKDFSRLAQLLSDAISTVGDEVIAALPAK